MIFIFKKKHLVLEAEKLQKDKKLCLARFLLLNVFSYDTNAKFKQ